MNDQQLLRYSRHILLEAIGIEGQRRLLSARVLVIGLGGKLLSDNAMDVHIMRSKLNKDTACHVCSDSTAPYNHSAPRQLVGGASANGWS